MAESCLNKSKTCICCLCRCQNHECFQQQVSKLPLWMQEHLNEETQGGKRCQATVLEKVKSELYNSSTYSNDYCSERNFIDTFPLEQNKLVASLDTGSGVMATKSIYGNDFIPWSHEEQVICKSKLYVPEPTLKEIEKEAENASYIRVDDKTNRLRSYYCPPHCVGEEKESPKLNCLMAYKYKFNIGPPIPKKISQAEADTHPFERFTNYKLDYKRHILTPRKKSEEKDFVAKERLDPMSSDTSYKISFPYPTQFEISRPSIHKEQPDTLVVGDGPMTKRSTSMLDYTDPGVQIQKPARPPPDAFQPPTSSMETETTMGISYPAWKTLPKVKHDKKTKISSTDAKKADFRNLLTTYQQDFDGISLALCPCRVVENCGPEVLKPIYNFSGTEDGHDVFYFNKKDLQDENIECVH